MEAGKDREKGEKEQTKERSPDRQAWRRPAARRLLRATDTAQLIHGPDHPPGSFFVIHSAVVDRGAGTRKAAPEGSAGRAEGAGFAGAAQVASSDMTGLCGGRGPRGGAVQAHDTTERWAPNRS
jgi:hypothetical protein